MMLCRLAAGFQLPETGLCFRCAGMSSYCDFGVEATASYRVPIRDEVAFCGGAKILGRIAERRNDRQRKNAALHRELCRLLLGMPSGRRAGWRPATSRLLFGSSLRFGFFVCRIVLSKAPFRFQGPSANSGSGYRAYWTTACDATGNDRSTSRIAAATRRRTTGLRAALGKASRGGAPSFRERYLRCDFFLRTREYDKHCYHGLRAHCSELRCCGGVKASWNGTRQPERRKNSNGISITVGIRRYFRRFDPSI